MKFQTPYRWDRAISARFATFNNEESMTQQSDRNNTDITLLMKKFLQTGQLPVVNLQPMYGDFSQVEDYRDALDKVAAANQAFMEVPAEIRAKFGNDPTAFVDFATDPANVEELRKMGLAVKPPEKPNEPKEIQPTPP